MGSSNSKSAAVLRSATAEKLGLKKPARAKYQVVLDPILAERFREAQDDYQLAKTRFEAQPDNPERNAAYSEAKARYEGLRIKASDQIVDVWFQGIGAIAWEELRDAHPITEDQRHELMQQGVPKEQLSTWNIKSFPPAAIAACAVDAVEDEDGVVEVKGPLWSIEDVEAMFADPSWNTAELMGMFQTCIQVNQLRSRVDLGKG